MGLQTSPTGLREVDQAGVDGKDDSEKSDEKEEDMVACELFKLMFDCLQKKGGILPFCLLMCFPDPAWQGMNDFIPALIDNHPKGR